jgi:hypothetical protein
MLRAIHFMVGNGKVAYAKGYQPKTSIHIGGADSDLRAPPHVVISRNSGSHFHEMESIMQA